MNYLEILKKFDKAIVTESQKLQEIYDNLVNDEQASNQVCDEDKKEENCDDCVKDEESKTDPNQTNPNQTDGPTTNDTQDESEDDRKSVCEFFEADEDEKDSDTQAEQPNDTSKPKGKSTEKLISKKDFFDDSKGAGSEGDDTVADDDDDKPVKKTGNEEVVTEVTDEQRQAIDASSLFEDDKETIISEQDTPEPKDGPAYDDLPPSKRENKPKRPSLDDLPTPKRGNDSYGESKNETMKDWLGEDKDDQNKVPEDGETKDPEDSEQSKEKDKNKCHHCGNDPCTCEEDDEAEGETQLRESIKNINAFVQANKKLFLID